MKKSVFLFVFLLFSLPVFAEEINSQPSTDTSATTSQNIVFEDCIRFFDVNQEKLFFMTLSSISANKYSVDEIQTTNGYIIFSANHRKFLATIAYVDNSNSVLKITPCNNVYNFSPMIVTNIFKYIEMNTKGNS